MYYVRKELKQASMISFSDGIVDKPEWKTYRLDECKFSMQSTDPSESVKLSECDSSNDSGYDNITLFHDQFGALVIYQDYGNDGFHCIDSGITSRLLFAYDLKSSISICLLYKLDDTCKVGIIYTVDKEVYVNLIGDATHTSLDGAMNISHKRPTNYEFYVDSNESNSIKLRVSFTTYDENTNESSYFEYEYPTQYTYGDLVSYNRLQKVIFNNLYKMTHVKGRPSYNGEDNSPYVQTENEAYLTADMMLQEGWSYNAVDRQWFKDEVSLKLNYNWPFFYIIDNDDNDSYVFTMKDIEDRINKSKK